MTLDPPPPPARGAPGAPGEGAAPGPAALAAMPPAPGAAPPPDPAPALTHAEVRGIIAGLVLAMLLAALDQTIVATALPTIGRELGDPAHLPWVVTAYLLASTAVTPLYGKLADARGRRPMLLLGIGLFLAGSVACALAPSLPLLVAARALQGLGGGGLISLAQTVIADVVPPRERGRYQVYIAGVFVTSSLAGPLLGGLIAEHLHWSVIFWINLPLGLAALLMTERRLRRLPVVARPGRLDLLGAALMVGATVALMLALSWGGVSYPWGSAPVLGLLAASAALWALFARRLATAREPLIPAGVLGNPVVRAGTLAAGFGMGTFIALSVTVPAYFEGAGGLAPSQSALALLPLMLGTVAGATVSGRAMTRGGRYKRLPMAGLALATLTALALAFAAERLPPAAVAGLLGLASLGMGTLLPVATVSIQNAVPPHEVGTATAAANFFRQLGGAVLVSLFGAVVALGAGGLHGAVEGAAQSVPLQVAALHAAFGHVFLAAAAGFALALACLAAMEERPLLSADERAAARGAERGAD